MTVIARADRSAQVASIVLIGMIPAFSNFALSLLAILSIRFVFELSWKRAGLILLLVAQYIILHLINLWLYPVLDPVMYHTQFTGLLFMGVFLAPVVALFMANDRLAKDWRLYGAIGLLIGFALLAADHFTPLLDGTADCRVSGLSFGSLGPPFLMLPVLVSLFLGWDGFSKKERWLRYLLVTLTVISIAKFSGSRMAFLCALVVLGALSVYLRSIGARSAFRGILIAVLVGILSTWLLELSHDCRFFYRLNLVPSALAMDVNGLQATLQAMVEDYPLKLDSSEERVLVWRSALRMISVRPLFGYGLANETEFLRILVGKPFFPFHAHQQYLSWFVWGGAISFVSGVIFLLMAPLTAYWIGSKDHFVLICLIALGPVLNLFTDSLFKLPEIFLGYTVIMIFVAVLLQYRKT